MALLIKNSSCDSREICLALESVHVARHGSHHNSLSGTELVEESAANFKSAAPRAADETTEKMEGENGHIADHRSRDDPFQYFFE